MASKTIQNAACTTSGRITKPKTSIKSHFNFASLPNELKLVIGQEYINSFEGTTAGRPSASKPKDDALGGAALLLANKEMQKLLKHDHLRQQITEFKTAADFYAFMSTRKAAEETFFVKNVAFDVHEREQSFSTEAMASSLFAESAIEHVELRGPSLTLHSVWDPCLDPAEPDYPAKLEENRDVELLVFDENASHFPRTLKTWSLRKREVSFWLTAAVRGVTCKVCERNMALELFHGRAEELREWETVFQTADYDWAPEAGGHTHSPNLTGELFESFSDDEQLWIMTPEKRDEYRQTVAYLEWKSLKEVNGLLEQRLACHKAVCRSEGMCDCWNHSPLDEDNPCAAKY